MKNYLKRTTTFILALLMLLSVPLQAFAQVNHEDLTKDKAEIINKKEPPLKPAKLEGEQTAADLIKNPDQPAIYTLRTDYKVQRGEKYEVDYQPYIASVGAAATDEEKSQGQENHKASGPYRLRKAGRRLFNYLRHGKECGRRQRPVRQ